jgi:beta-lactamase class A
MNSFLVGLIAMQNWQKYLLKIKEFARAYHGWLFLILIGLIFSLGYWQGERIEKKRAFLQERQTSQLRQKSGYKFISPLLECESYSEGNFLRSKEMESSLQKLIERINLDSDIGHISIYFRDLNNGPWLGFNEDEKFTPASLLKVPVMIAYFKKAQESPGYLEKELVYEKVASKNEFIPKIKSDVKLQAGKKYPIKDLIRFMIASSDNESARVLIENIDPVFLVKVYSDLMIPVPGESGGSENFMTVKEYASFFRILYNASYLNSEMSEMALKILSESSFKDGLVSGVPENVLVSHKFGERITDNLMQLHDCGIVYKEDKPYLICVMTRGENFEKLKWVIKATSERIWNEIQKQ